MFAPRNERERKKLEVDDRRRGAPLDRDEGGERDDRERRAARGSRGEPQPHALPSTSASTSAVRPTVSAAMPGKSTLRADGLVARLVRGEQRHRDRRRRRPGG